jgi:drug/metabolite transporter (DMT)-like permease
MIAAWQMIFGLLPLLVIGFIIDGNPMHFRWTKTAVFCLFYLAVIGSALAFLLLYWLMPRMSVTNLQTIALITPPGAVVFGWLVGGETFSLWALAGGALVLAGVWMIFRRIEAVKPVRESETALPRG